MSDEPSALSSFPVSIKGVVLREDRVLLLRNERDEWELPGGRIEPGETPEACLAREFEEEAGWPVTVAAILDAWLYYIPQADQHVFIVTYGCHAGSDTPVVLSNEHKESALFGQDEIPDLPMPDGYKRSVLTWFAHPEK